MGEVQKFTDAAKAAESRYGWVRVSVFLDGEIRVRTVWRGSQEVMQDDITDECAGLDDAEIKTWVAEEYECLESEVEVFHEKAPGTTPV